MKPNIQVFGEAQLDELLKTGGTHFSHCISIGDPGTKMLESIRTNFASYLRIEFHDIGNKSEMSQEEDGRVPRISDIKKILSFYYKTKNVASGYTIHCHAGVHRSAAVGLALLYLMLGSEEKAVEAFYKIKAFGMPNKKMIQLFDKVLHSNLAEVNKEMWTKISKFLNGDIDVNKDDYLEELPVVKDIIQ